MQKTAILIKRSDRGVSIMALGDAVNLKKPKQVEKAVRRAELAFQEDFPGVTFDSWAFCDPQALPPKELFRGAWVHTEKGIVVDMDKARALHLQDIRAARASKFIEMGFPHKLHPDLEKAVLPAPVALQLQALRDLPTTFDMSTATTPEELKELWPAELQ